jgi:hypothetical protein
MCEDVPKLLSDRIEVGLVWPAAVDERPAPAPFAPPEPPLDPDPPVGDHPPDDPFVPDPPEVPPGAPASACRLPPVGAASFLPCSAGISYTTPEGLSASGSLGTP